MDFENIDTEAGVENLHEKVDPISSKNVEFVVSEDDIGKYQLPTPAHEHIPSWYKGTDMYLENTKLDKTVRGCMPFMESLHFGWIIEAPVDIEIQQLPGGINITWRDETFNAVGTHELEQVGGENFPHQDITIIKFNLPYLTRTPKGVSSLYMPPLNRFEPRFRAFSGVVDTDEYLDKINIPAILWDVNYEGIIKAGTPIAQLIPFERNSTPTKSIKRTMTENEERLYPLTNEAILATDGYYKNRVWKPKKASTDDKGCPFK